MTYTHQTCHLCMARGCDGSCTPWIDFGRPHNPCPPPLPAAPTPAPVGCICPPGANKECENPTCPRKPAQSDRDERDAPAADKDGWIPWPGGERPVHPKQRVAVRFRTGSCSDAASADPWWWMHDGSDLDIVAYRLLEPVREKEGKA